MSFKLTSLGFFPVFYSWYVKLLPLFIVAGDLVEESAALPSVALTAAKETRDPSTMNIDESDCFVKQVWSFNNWICFSPRFLLLIMVTYYLCLSSSDQYPIYLRPRVSRLYFSSSDYPADGPMFSYIDGCTTFKIRWGTSRYCVVVNIRCGLIYVYNIFCVCVVCFLSGPAGTGYCTIYKSVASI